MEPSTTRTNVGRPSIYLLGPSVLDRLAYRVLLKDELNHDVAAESSFAPTAVWAAMRAKPDLALVILVFLAHRRGSMYGQIAGFAAGMIQDYLSLAPLGFHALIGTAIGFAYGITAGNVFADPIFVPMVFVAVATLVKGIIAAILGAIFGLDPAASTIASRHLWIELGYNAFLAPFLFAFLGIFRAMKSIEREKL